MEGPSIYLAAKQLSPFVKQRITEIAGNTKIGKERMDQMEILDIFSWGKHLVFQFDRFAMRVHFMLYGSFQATVRKKKVTGDYPTKNRPIRLQFQFPMGHIEFYNCSIKYIEESESKLLYDYSIDIMSPLWDPEKAFEKILGQDEEIGDLLLDQNIFAGVGNIIKNEVLFLTKILPQTLAKDISMRKLKQIIRIAKSFSLQFYRWRKRFVLKEHYQIYRRSLCPICQQKVTRRKTGRRERMSFFCTSCQKGSEKKV